MKFFFTLLCAIQIIALTGCSSSDEEEVEILSSRDLEMYHNDNSQIECNGANEIIYSSEDEYVASVSSSGMITANCVGETFIDINGERTIKISVIPANTSFVEPVHDFKLTKQQVIAQCGSNYSTSSSTNGITYTKSGTIAGHLYLFDDNNILKSSGVLVKTYYLESYMDFLAERYLPAGWDEENSMAIFVNGVTKENITMAVSVSVYSISYLLSAYVPVDLTKSRAVKSELIKKELIKVANEFIR